MRTTSVAICFALTGLWAASFPALAQQKTVKACQAEWQANKADNQAKGITEKAYVDQCRASGTAATPAATPAASSKFRRVIITPFHHAGFDCFDVPPAASIKHRSTVLTVVPRRRPNDEWVGEKCGEIVQVIDRIGRWRSTKQRGGIVV